MPTKPPIIIAAALSIGLILLVIIIILFQQLNHLTTQVATLQNNQQTSADYVTRVYVDTQLDARYKQLDNALNQAMHTSAVQSNELTQQIANTHGLVLGLVEEIHGGIAHDSRILDQIDSTHATVDSVLTTLERNQQHLAKLVPSGTVIAYAGQWQSASRERLKKGGWLLCDGRRVAVKEYPDLYRAIGTTYGGKAGQNFRLPDFRGVFLRGLDLGRKLDSRRQLGSYQKDSNRSHTHQGNIAAAGTHQHEARTEFSGQHQHLMDAEGPQANESFGRRRLSTTTSDSDYRHASDEAGSHRHSVRINSAGEHQHTLTIENSGGREARPKNYPVVYLIKY